LPQILLCSQHHRRISIVCQNIDAFIADIIAVDGVASATLQPSEQVVYLKVDNAQLDKDKFQYELSQK
jgi:hypothetical protein